MCHSLDYRCFHSFVNTIYRCSSYLFIFTAVYFANETLHAKDIAYYLHIGTLLVEKQWQTEVIWFPRDSVFLQTRLRKQVLNRNSVFYMFLHMLCTEIKSPAMANVMRSFVLLLERSVCTDLIHLYASNTNYSKSLMHVVIVTIRNSSRVILISVRIISHVTPVKFLKVTTWNFDTDIATWQRRLFLKYRVFHEYARQAHSRYQYMSFREMQPVC